MVFPNRVGYLWEVGYMVIRVRKVFGILERTLDRILIWKDLERF